MLQWYGNMPEETVWYKYRMFGDWQWVSIAILVGYWAFPLVFHWLDMYRNAMPSYDWTKATHGGATLVEGPLMNQIALHHVGFTPLDITVWLALVGVLLVGIGRNMTGNLIAIKDPTLGLSLAHEQL